MKQLTRQITNKIDKLKFGSYLGALFVWGLIYFVLILMTMQGPTTHIEETITNKHCQGELWKKQSTSRGFNETAAFHNNLYCYFIKEFTECSARFSLKIQAIPPANASHHRTEIDVTVSEIGTIYDDVDGKDIEYYINLNEFPYLNRGLLNPVDEEWIIITNNQTTSTPLKCDFIQKQGYSCETGNFLQQKINGYTRIVTLVKIPEANAYEFERVNFVAVYPNPHYEKFASVFNGLFIIASFITLFVFYQNMNQLPFHDWNFIQKWVATLLLAQIFYNNPLTVIGNFMKYNQSVLYFGDEFFQTLYYSLILYFWLSLYDGMFFEREYTRSPNFINIIVILKTLIVGVVLFINCMLKIPGLYKELKSEYTEVQGEDKLIEWLENVSKGSLFIYFVYYLFLAITYKTSPSQGKTYNEKSRSIGYLFTSSLIVFLIFAFNSLQSDVDTLKGSTVSHFSLVGALNIYTFAMAYFFTPENLEKLKDIQYKSSTEADDIIRDVYGDEMIEMDEYEKKKKEAGKEQKKDMESDPKEKEKKRIWEQIQKSNEDDDDEDEGQKKSPDSKEEGSDDDKDLEYYN